MNFSIKTKIIATSTIAVLIMMTISVIAGMQTSENLKIYKTIADVNFPNAQAAGNMEIAVLSIEAATNLLIGSSASSEEVKIASEKVELAIKIFHEEAKKYESLPFAPGEEEVWNDLKANFWDKYYQEARNIVQLSATQKEEDRVVRDQFAVGPWRHRLESRDKYFSKLHEFISSEVEKNNEAASNRSHLLSWLIPVLLAAGGFISILLSVILGHVIAKNLSQITELINKASLQVSSAAAQIATSSQDLSQTSTEQASSLEETAASLEEITSMISRSTENAQSTSETSMQSQKKAEEGRVAVDQMMTSMDEITESNNAILAQINESNRQMSDIVKVIQDIGDKTKVINEIVFQTKLLSFNASVEAARAGEHGKGFAVVAEEVGNLAQMSGNAAKEITDMLEGSITKVEEIVRDTQSKVESLVQNGKDKIDSGVTVSKKCAEILSEIVENVSKVSVLSQEISQASREQSLGVSEINKAMSQLDIVTQKNATTSEEAAKSAQELSTQANSLKSSVENLTSVIMGTVQKPVEEISNVTPLKIPRISKEDISKPALMKKVSGDLMVPHRDDERFKEE